MRHAAVVATPYVAFSEMFLNPQNLRFVGRSSLILPFFVAIMKEMILGEE